MTAASFPRRAQLHAQLHHHHLNLRLRVCVCVCVLKNMLLKIALWEEGDYEIHCTVDLVICLPPIFQFQALRMFWRKGLACISVGRVPSRPSLAFAYRSTSFVCDLHTSLQDRRG